MIKGTVKPIRDVILASDMNFEQHVTSGGIIIRSDNGQSHGVRPRWCRVWAVGPEQKEVTVGEWILVEHGRWTRGFELEENSQVTTIRKIDNAAILLASDICPNDY